MGCPVWPALDHVPLCPLLEVKGKVNLWHIEWGSGGSPKKNQGALTRRRGNVWWASQTTEIHSAELEGAQNKQAGLLHLAFLWAPPVSPVGPEDEGEKQKA